MISKNNLFKNLKFFLLQPTIKEASALAPCTPPEKPQQDLDLYQEWEDIINAPSAKYLAQSMVENICVLQNGPNAAFAYGRALRERGGKVQGSPLTRIAARNKVAHFILEFMFPGYTNESVGVTYDAAGAKITKIFSQKIQS